MCLTKRGTHGAFKTTNTLEGLTFTYVLCVELPIGLLFQVGSSELIFLQWVSKSKMLVLSCLESRISYIEILLIFQTLVLSFENHADITHWLRETEEEARHPTVFFLVQLKANELSRSDSVTIALGSIGDPPR